MSRLSEWYQKWFGTGTEDDRRNFGWRVTEYFRVAPEWSRYLFDVRLGFRRGGKWRSCFGFWSPVSQNFWNGIFTFNVYVLKTTFKRIPLLLPRFNLVIRPARSWYFQTGAGFLFDRGEFGIKLRIARVVNEARFNPGDAKEWDEGPV